MTISSEDAPVNLHTKPSPALRLLMIPPDATRSRLYLQFHATRCPLSMMYFSFSRSCIHQPSATKQNFSRGR